VSITLTEGKFRQVRKMTAAVGLPTLRLVRVRVGSIWLGDLVPGAVREVADFGVEYELNNWLTAHNRVNATVSRLLPSR
jgi:16S rRNA U516 pseudouridylate synthase RsuA-like enzyme